MKQNRELTELKNVCKKIAGRLNEVGIFMIKKASVLKSIKILRLLLFSNLIPKK